eukprot:TRINITY_DN110582_c0_g1_i1.p1 TRINITY_DN110582_c0_g1~~TRINITY_DN110582_c0_g1_i1.p1  ORF type:complete len:206 (-),score=30.39 TRINITY_DN110582_c0_g1_i1:473-1090(-)
MAGVLSGAWAGYRHALLEKPFRTKALTSLVLFSTGSAAAQDVEHRRQALRNSSGSVERQISPRKIAACGAYGATMYAPGMHMWYQLLERQLPSAALSATCCKLFLHSMIAAPCIIASFTIATKTLEGAALEQSLGALVESGPKMWFTALGFINIGLFINYHFMPLHYRVVFGNFVQLLWTAYQSWELQRAQVERDQQKCSLVETR